MTVHAVAVIEVTDPATFGRYAAKAAEALAKHDGRVVAVAAPDGEPLEDTGAASGAILVVLEFPSADAARAWIADPTSQSIHDLRRAGAKTTIRLMKPR